ncbi:3 beta-hydroxysteroid dehydrogenase/Delta 5--_4-isomerase-like [Mercenaria mercenaria]|uniref:3 beta-hydroxysteroid dehydrogenase/Delta 5-->4-isomerase-like n=1 Tax=Mercenaria mercenaria TaxID=6596 RepID=UPI00234E4366|nr:3 beta-hydroxysteroid dehydrogenase/Delta 5-->4-isomerase-like [Mercenaria mercenaria]
MVTGGAGFLGQHIVSLLQTKAPHVREIRVLDLKLYNNFLGHSDRKPISSVIGSVTDLSILAEALKGVDSVYHIAGKISYGTFPDFKGMYNINVEGTANLIKACLLNDVKRFIYCSTVDVVIGYDDIIDGNEANTAPPTEFLFPGYPETKYKAECLVLKANGTPTQNGSLLQTMSLRANVMYGEGDPYYITNGLRNARDSNGTLYQVGNGTALFQPVYVGNTAWAFICADKELTGNSKLGGKFYFIPDDTPQQNTFEFMEPFLEVRGYRLSSIKFPFRLVYIFLLFSELVVKALSPLIKINLPAESYSVKYINMTLTFSSMRARQELGFKPIFSPEEAKQRSLLYYKHMEL